MNNDLISRSELKEKVNAFYDSLFVGCVSSDLIAYASGVDSIINNAPTVDIPTELCKGCRFLKDCETCEEKLRPQGEWAEIEGGYICSNCEDIEAYTPNFCPNCGADMRKGGAE